MTYNRDTKGKFTSKYKHAILAIIIGGFLACLMVYIVNYNTTEYINESVEVRTAIERLTDNVAKTYTILQEKELDLASSTNAYNIAVENWNSAIEYLTTYTK